MDGQNCANCRFFKRSVRVVYLGENEDDPFHGVCRAHPRTVYERSVGARDLYPHQKETDWCGEWVPANPETVEQGAAVMARLVLLGDLTAARALADKLTGGD